MTACVLIEWSQNLKYESASALCCSDAACGANFCSAACANNGVAHAALCGGALAALRAWQVRTALDSEYEPASVAWLFGAFLLGHSLG